MYDLLPNMISPLHPVFQGMNGSAGMDMFFPQHPSHFPFGQNGYPHQLLPHYSSSAASSPLGFPAAHSGNTHHRDVAKNDSKIKVQLANETMWKEFHSSQSEMIVTKHGRRMFPTLEITVTGLEEDKKYFILLDIVPADDSRYKFQGKEWIVAGKAEPHMPGRLYIHPESPQTGGQWMKNKFVFQKLKLTNNNMDQYGHMILSSMHKYIPRIHIVAMTDIVQIRWAHFNTFVFDETEFIAVTAYQNEKIKQLKIQYNPFAKGFRDTNNSRNKNNKKITASLQSHRDRSPLPSKGIDEFSSVRKRLCSESDMPAETQFGSDIEDRPFPYMSFDKEDEEEEDEEGDEKIDVESVLTPAPSIRDQFTPVPSMDNPFSTAPVMSDQFTPVPSISDQFTPTPSMTDEFCPSSSNNDQFTSAITPPDQSKTIANECSESTFAYPPTPASSTKTRTSVAQSRTPTAPIPVTSRMLNHEVPSFGQFPYHSPFNHRDPTSHQFSSPLHHPYFPKPPNIASHLLDRHFASQMLSYDKTHPAADLYSSFNSLLSNNFANKYPNYSPITPARPSPIHPFFSFPAGTLPIL